MSSPPAERTRTEDTPITRSDIWYKDGSVVLQAQNTQFRVHWSILGQHSSFFRDMEGLPQPPDQPSVEGCPVVELLDGAKAVEHLLRMLYNMKLLYQPALPFAVVESLVCLGHKYGFQDLLDSAVERITFEYPTTLEEFDALVFGGKYTRIVPQHGLVFDILRLARENDIVSALPAAYYCAIDQGLDKLLDGLLASPTPVDLRRCIRGREKLINAQFQPGYTFGWLRSWDSDAQFVCTGTSGCTRVRDTLFRKNTETFRVLALSVFVTKGLCDGCTNRAIELTTAGRKKVWAELPGFFDLPPWSELKNDL
ncbi:hypothetical protein B0H13DRAFT_1949554 [Mycena leptocephala]|nr:hypothetical protein B0H13DRAFT_1949554 [Mycena leptocephala]